MAPLKDVVPKARTNAISSSMNTVPSALVKATYLKTVYFYIDLASLLLRHLNTKQKYGLPVLVPAPHFGGFVEPAPPSAVLVRKMGHIMRL